jgi:hypothetical protein
MNHELQVPGFLTQPHSSASNETTSLQRGGGARERGERKSDGKSFCERIRGYDIQAYKDDLPSFFSNLAPQNGKGDLRSNACLLESPLKQINDRSRKTEVQEASNNTFVAGSGSLHMRLCLEYSSEHQKKMQREISGEDTGGGRGGGGGDKAAATSSTSSTLDYVLHVNLISGSNLFAAGDDKAQAQLERQTGAMAAGAARAAGDAAGVLLLLLLLVCKALLRFY